MTQVVTQVKSQYIESKKLFIKEINVDDRVVYGLFKTVSKIYDVIIEIRTGTVVLDTVEEVLEELMKRLDIEKMSIVPQRIIEYTNYTVDCSKPSKFSDTIVCVVY